MIFWEKLMYHQSTLKIFSPQYLGMFAVNRESIRVMEFHLEYTGMLDSYHYSGF